MDTLTNNSSLDNMEDVAELPTPKPTQDVNNNDDDDVVSSQSSSSSEGDALDDVETSSEGDADDVETTDGVLSSSPNEKAATTTPEPPRWRFINEAKKSLGYSSLNAGSYIKGQSNEDLGAKYVAPDISLYSPKGENVQPKKVSFQLPTKMDLTKDDVEVGKLDVYLPSEDELSVDDNKVGKLQINSNSSQSNIVTNAQVGKLQANDSSAMDSAQAPSRRIAGLPKSDINDTDCPTKQMKEWSNAYQVGPKNGERDHVVDTSNDSYSYTMPGIESPDQKSRNAVGRLKFHSTEETDEEHYDVGYMKNEVEYHDGTWAEAPEGGDNVGDLAMAAKEWDPSAIDKAHVTSTTNGSVIESTNTSKDSKDVNGMSVLAEATMIQKAKKRNRWLFLLILLLLLLAVLLGVLFGTSKNSEEKSTAVASEGTGTGESDLLVPPVVGLNDTINEPQCPVDSKLLTITHTSSSEELTSNSDFTWKITEACSGDIIAQCQPCSLTSLFDKPFDDILNITTECLPIASEYIIEILPAADDSEPCCGFDPDTSIISYDDEIVTYGDPSDTSMSSSNVFFVGDNEAPCSTANPILSPPIEPDIFGTPPTPQEVTCTTEQQDFNLCLAVDMSGSVCNDGVDGSTCDECTVPTIFGIPFTFDYDCRDSYVSEDTCCRNFANVKDFSSTMVYILGLLSGEKSFSMVQFATSAQIISYLDSYEQTRDTIDRLDYTGGMTNHASAIQACQQTLSYGNSSKKNFIMLITDGVPSKPEYDPEGAAEAAARTVKTEDTFIIPVFISSFYDEDALAFMSRLSSDGKVFDVTDFTSLNSLQDSLVDQVSCS